MDVLKRARMLSEEIAENRRVLHGYAEVGFDLPQTCRFVMERLKEYGCAPYEMGRSGICCDLGQMEGPTVLLRADMDALPMEERSGLPYAACNGHAHACGHDIHAAMLLGTAKLLKSCETELQGRVRLMFQPAEELLAGAADMIECGVLNDVSAAFGLHVAAGTDCSEAGKLYCPNGPGSNSGDSFTVTVRGKSAHGSMPEKGVDAILIAARIIDAFQSLINCEVGFEEHCVLLVGTIQGGTSANTVAGEAQLGVSLRTDHPDVRERMKERLPQVAKAVADTYRGSVEVHHNFGVPGLQNNEMLCRFARERLTSLFGEDNVGVQPKLAGEDFSLISERVPAVFLGLGCGSPEEGYRHSMHEPEVHFDESVFWRGTAALSELAVNYLQQTQV